MKQLWAPWRMKYIKESIENKDKSCFLCNAYTNRQKKDSLVVAVFAHSFVVMNKFPYNNGHLMIVPIKHTGNIAELSTATQTELIKVISITTDVLSKEMNAEGFNVGMNLGRVAGAGVPDHLHIHVVPRWNGDTNYMPIITDTKVISQGLEETYNLLKTAFEGIKNEI